MHELAKYAMRGPSQTILVSSIAMLIPMMFWFSAAIVALVTLRKGVQQGAVVFFWTVLPAMAWLLSVQDPGALFVLMLAFIMACVLRASMSWQSTLLAGAVLSMVLGWLTPVLLPGLIEILMNLADAFFKQLAEQSDQAYDAETQASFRSLLVAGFASSFYGIAIGSVCLARSWQAKLFNPGGWQQELHKIRIQPKVLLGILLVISVVPTLGLNGSVVLFVAIVLLVFCGIALVHGLIAMKKMAVHWLIGFYMSIIFLFPTILLLVVLAAIVDSLIDFRSKVSTPLS